MVESECDETLSDVESWVRRVSNAMTKISAETYTPAGQKKCLQSNKAQNSIINLFNEFTSRMCPNSLVFLAMSTRNAFISMNPVEAKFRAGGARGF